MSFPLIFLMGPTAVGKTDYAVALSQFFPIEIISVDSALVYRGMDIGTAKPSIHLRKQVPHHLIDILEPVENYSAAQFCDDVQRLIPEILARGKVPLLVGGTMMYYQSLIRGLSPLPSAEPSIRAELEEDAKKLGWPALHARLEKIDPETFARLHPNDAQRIQRALEIYLITQKPLSAWLAEGNSVFPYEYHALALAPPERDVLHQRIAVRFTAMLKNGLIEEVQQLMLNPVLNLNKPALRAVGYRQVWQGLEENWPQAEIRERGIIATRQLAKRQLTWLRSWPDLTWFDSTAPDCLKQLQHALAQIWRA